MGATGFKQIPETLGSAEGPCYVVGSGDEEGKVGVTKGGRNVQQKRLPLGGAIEVVDEVRWDEQDKGRANPTIGTRANYEGYKAGPGIGTNLSL
ncbi:MAG: hypothetical protein OIF55_08385 [Amphritea sp.]|nr:hypothetical protein [Amphritea sp.]